MVKKLWQAVSKLTTFSMTMISRIRAILGKIQASPSMSITKPHGLGFFNPGVARNHKKSFFDVWRLKFDNLAKRAIAWLMATIMLVTPSMPLLTAGIALLPLLIPERAHAAGNTYYICTGDLATPDWWDTADCISGTGGQTPDDGDTGVISGSWVLLNSGAFTVWTGGNIGTLQVNEDLTVQNSGSLTIGNWGSLTIENWNTLFINGSSTLTVQGTGSLLVDGSLTVDTSTLTIQNNGTVTVTPGTLTVQNTATLAVDDGTLSIGNAAMMIMNMATMTVNNGGIVTAIDGAVIQVNSTPITVDNSTVSITDSSSLQLGSTSAFTVQNTGIFTIDSGSMSVNDSTLSVLSGSSMIMEDSLTVDDANLTIDTSATMTINTGTLTMNDASTIVIQNAGQMNVETGAVVSMDASSVTVSAGSFLTSAAGSSLTLDNSSGLFVAATGAVSINDSLTVDNSSTVNNSGTLTVQATGTLTVQCDASISSDNILDNFGIFNYAIAAPTNFTNTGTYNNSGTENDLCGFSPFITTWKTDNAGTSGSTSITIPTTGAGYNYDVDWNNDGTFDEFGLTGSVTHNFWVAGTYTIRIQWSFPRIHVRWWRRWLRSSSISLNGEVSQWTSMAECISRDVAISRSQR
jgi:hypothetical protein